VVTYFIPMTPEIYPESNPKKIPPKDAKAHIRYALRVTGASILERSPAGARPPAIIREFALKRVSRTCCGVKQRGGCIEQRLRQFVAEDQVRY
jgi:hypothetical protein